MRAPRHQPAGARRRDRRAGRGDASASTAGSTCHDALRPDGSWKHLLRELLEPQADEPLALVGHEPTIGHYLSKLLHQKGLSMAKGTVVRLDWHDADTPAAVVWTLSPKRLDPSPSL